MAKALIAMSGGVDSSVAAYLAKTEGFNCIGATMQLLDGAEKSTFDAEKICEKLNIPFYSFDMRKEFKALVIDEFIRAFENGETPNPCVLCNKALKFGLLAQKAKELGCEFIVTGHYAKIEYDNGQYFLAKSENKAKDQSYFLYSLSSDILQHIKFPLSKYSKEEIRKIADNLGFATANKKDSQDICFVPDGDYAKIIKEITGKTYKSGDFVDLDGKILGKHQGIINYTIGQRKGLGIAFGKPMYVCQKDCESNKVTLCEDAMLYKNELTAKNFNWLIKSDLTDGLKCKARIRYRHEEQSATVFESQDGVLVKFDQPQRAITPGQSVVLYDGGRVLGGGIIA